MNPNNKQCFNNLSNVLMENLFETLHAADNADCLIVGTTLKLERNSHRSRWRRHGLTGPIISIISRLTWALQSFAFDRYQVCSRCQGRKSCPGSNRSRDICENTMFGHAVGGYDITSSIFSAGKGLPMQKLKESPLFRNHAKVFTTKSNSQERERGGNVAWMTAWTRFDPTNKHQNYSSVHR